jgi:hypothetical protein
MDSWEKAVQKRRNAAELAAAKRWSHANYTKVDYLISRLREV